MGRLRSIAELLLTGIVALGGAGYYLWARLVRDVGFSLGAAHALTWLLGGLALSVPIGVIASRYARPELSVWWVRPIYVGIGVATLTVISLLAIDGVRLATGVGRAPAQARAAAMVALAMGLGASVQALREGRTVRVKRVEVPLRRLPAAYDGFRIVQISDLHVGPTQGRAFIDHVVATVNDLQPDVVAITGDLVDGSVEDLAEHVAPLARLASMHGSYFVTGNHEYHAGAPAWCEHLETLGLRVLRNEHVELARRGQTIHLAGVDDFEASRFAPGHAADVEQAVAGRDPERALILLAHQPRTIDDAVRHGVDLQLSGHTHGGQLWPLGALHRLAQPAVAGLSRFGETYLYVSCGTGASGPPMRLGAPAEITELVLRCAG